MNEYLAFVEQVRDCVKEARGIELTPSRRPAPEAGPVVMLFSPHPDDECITGLLPLRLMREAGCRIVNVPVTFGSNVARQAGRSEELSQACGYLGWQLARGVDGFETLTAPQVAALMREFEPVAVVVPHAKDWNSRHISTHHLVMEGLDLMDSAFECMLIETEFWGAMDDPNLMVEADAELVAELVAAISLHVGEVARNPYHLLLPAWMQDNVRRGGELVCGQGAAVPEFDFATLYRFGRWRRGEYKREGTAGTAVPVGTQELKELFQWK